MKKLLTNLLCNSQLFLFLIFIFTAYLRLVNITRVGLIGSDVFQYWEVAQRWTQLDFTLDGYYRPVAYLLNAFSFLLFGPKDYSIGLLNSLLDLINIYLIYNIGLQITGKRTLGLSAVIFYAFLPAA